MNRGKKSSYFEYNLFYLHSILLCCLSALDNSNLKYNHKAEGRLRGDRVGREKKV